jgi:hypothetical protein
MRPNSTVKHPKGVFGPSVALETNEARLEASRIGRLSGEQLCMHTRALLDIHNCRYA